MRSLLLPPAELPPTCRPGRLRVRTHVGADVCGCGGVRTVEVAATAKPIPLTKVPPPLLPSQASACADARARRFVSVCVWARTVAAMYHGPESSVPSFKGLPAGPGVRCLMPGVRLPHAGREVAACVGARAHVYVCVCLPEREEAAGWKACEPAYCMTAAALSEGVRGRNDDGQGKGNVHKYPV